MKMVDLTGRLQHPLIEYTSPDPLIFDNVCLYGPGGKIAKKYKQASLAGEATKNEQGNYLRMGQKQLIYCFRGSGKQLPSYAILNALVERMETEGHPGKEDLVRDLRERWILAGDRFDYAKGTVTPEYGFSEEKKSCSFPQGSGYMDELVKDPQWRSVFQTLLMPENLDIAIERWHSFSGFRPYIWTPSAEARNWPPRQAVLNIGTFPTRLGFFCSGFGGSHYTRLVELKE